MFIIFCYSETFQVNAADNNNSDDDDGDDNDDGGDVMACVCLVQEALPTWDKQIQSLCFQVNSIIEKIAATAPDWLSTACEHEMTS